MCKEITKFCTWSQMQNIYSIALFERGDFNEIRQQQKKLKAMDVKEA